MSDDDPSDRLGAVAVLVAGLAHELRNVLAAADSSLYLAERAKDDAERATRLAGARTSVRTAQDLVGRVLSPVRGEPATFEPIAARVLLEAATRTAREDPAVAVTLDVAPADLEVRADPLLVTRALENLVDNARQVAAAAGRARVTIALGARLVADELHLTVEDDGPGIDPSVRDRLFEPLSTARPSGTGIGLCFVRTVAALHGGRATGDDGAGGGALFSLVLPAGPRPPLRP